jgi:hypothetical protein
VNWAIKVLESKIKIDLFSCGEVSFYYKLYRQL